MAASNQADTVDNAKDDPDTLSEYQMDGEIASGAFGTVYRATHKRNKESYAIKSVNIGFLNTTNTMFTVKRERRAGRELTDCPFIVRTFSSFTRNKDIWFIMERADNGQLERLIDCENGLQTHISRFYAAQIVAGLEYMRTKGWVHRDLSGKNLLLDKNNCLKIADFGLAKKINDPNSGGQGGTTAKSTDVGQINIKAPEILKQEPTTFSSDYWSLGAIIFQMQENERAFPYYGPSVDTVGNILKGRHRAYKDRNSVDDQLYDIVRKLLVVNTDKRLGSQDIGDIKSHPFFQKIDWPTLHLQHRPHLDYEDFYVTSNRPAPEMIPPTPAPPPPTVHPVRAWFSAITNQPLSTKSPESTPLLGKDGSNRSTCPDWCC